MPAYFASDVHLRFDRPERARRFAAWVDRLEGADTLTIVGDLCDFRFAARRSRRDPLECSALAALVAFKRRGGSTTILAGNHDAQLGLFYRNVLGAGFVADSLDLAIDGLRIRAVHGHRLGRRKPWKAAMEGRTFLELFRMLPDTVADRLETRLERSNERGLADCERIYLESYQAYAESIAGEADVLVLGHIHKPIDRDTGGARMIVLGGWHDRSSYLRVDDQGARLCIIEEIAPAPEARPVD